MKQNLKFPHFLPRPLRKTFRLPLFAFLLFSSMLRWRSGCAPCTKLLSLPSVVGAIALVFILHTSSFAADPTPITASLKNPSTVIRSDAKTGSYQGSISVSNAIAVGCDGTTIAVLSANGNVTRYDAHTGSYQGSISAGAKSTSVQVTGGVITVQKDRTLTRYDAKSGSYLGASSP